MKTCRSFLLLSLLLAASRAAIVCAETDPVPDPSSCAEFVKKCFLHGESERGACFLDAGKDQICKDDPLGKLALKRAGFAPSMQGESSTGGPQLVDKQCVASFDAMWSSLLLEKSAVMPFESLNSALDKCAINPPVDVSRRE